MATLTTAVETFPMRIGGEDVTSAQTMDVVLPYDGSVVARVHAGDCAALARAVAAARQAATAMAALPNCERADLLERIATFLRRDVEHIAHWICLETGKPIKEARLEANRGLETLRAAAIAARDLHGEVVAMDASPSGVGRMAMTVREPVGVIGAITPFNFPFNLTLHKLAPALAAGNAVIHKPGDRTPVSALLLARLVEEAGAPRGAYNVLPGDGPGLGQALVSDPGVDMITFTGSVGTGKAIRAAAGLKKVTLELGNNSALILEPDGDMSTAVARSVTGSFTHSGQVCISVQRIFVHESVAEEFQTCLVAATEKLVCGHPLDERTDISSLIAEKEAIRVEEWIDEAVSEGARVLTGGRRRYATITPAVLTDVPATVRLSCREVFGPVVAVYTYRSLDAAIEAVNGTPYGLQAGIFTTNIDRAFAAARRLRVGGVMINDIPSYRADHMPYGGVKESGLGREGPRYAIEEMSEMKLICWRA
jgi:acyl-CoA reductase-like NAD-dependent aldehyde dehydrogenase